MSDRLSWWVGLSRGQLQWEIAQREEAWRRQMDRFLDHLGAQMVRESWREPKPATDEC